MKMYGRLKKNCIILITAIRYKILFYAHQVKISLGFIYLDMTLSKYENNRNISMY